MALTKIKTGGIADNAITNAKMADDAINSDDFADASIDNVHVATGLDAVKLADGTVTNTEFQYINTLSSNAQTQISGKQASGNYITGTGSLSAQDLTDIGNLSNTNTGDQTLPTDFVSAASGGTFSGNVSFGDNNITNVGDISLDSISSDAGTSINVVLGSDAGDDFTVDTSKLVVEGDTGNVGIGTTDIQGGLHVLDSSYSIWATTITKTSAALRVETHYNANGVTRAPGLYGGGIAFNHLGGHGVTHNDNLHAYIGLRVENTPGHEYSNLVFATNNTTGTEETHDAGTTERMCITPDGNVGISHLNPSEKLEVTGTVKATSFDGSGSSLTDIGAGLHAMQVFTSSGTWTKPSGVTTIKVIVTGGGGGSCAPNSDDTTGGGGAGATAIKIIDVSSVASVSVTVGAGQAARANNGGNGVTHGNSSSFGSYCSATAGANGSGYWSLGGTGGTATGGDINLPGGDGHGGNIDHIISYVTSGTGGSSYWGGGGRGASINSGSGGFNSGKAPGSGGGGGVATSPGGAGAAGICVIEEYK